MPNAGKRNYLDLIVAATELVRKISRFGVELFAAEQIGAGKNPSPPFGIAVAEVEIIAMKNFETLPKDQSSSVNGDDGRSPISRDTNQEFEAKLTFGQKLADQVALFGGSWKFIIIFGVILLSWVLLNAVILAARGDTFDPYPYILLNLFLSMLAAIQAPIILMSQNRQSIKDRLAAAHDYEVNLKAELEIIGLHDKLDELRESKWENLISMQQKQIELLMQLLQERALKIKNVS